MLLLLLLLLFLIIIIIIIITKELIKVTPSQLQTVMLKSATVYKLSC